MELNSNLSDKAQTVVKDTVNKAKDHKENADMTESEKLKEQAKKERKNMARAPGRRGIIT